MLRSILIAAAVAASTAAYAAEPVRKPPPIVAPAVNGPQGYIGDRWGALWDGGGTQLILEKTAAANVPTAFGGFEIEGRGAGVYQKGASAGIGMGMGHLHLKNQSRALGVFGGFETFPGNGLIVAGAEAQFYRGPVILTAQIATAPAYGGGSNAWWARGSAAYFMNNNLMLTGDVRYLQGAVKSWLLAGTVEFRAGNTPWAGFATLKYQSGVGSAGGSATALLAGVHIHLGNGSLYQAYTSGAIWNVLPTLF